MSITFRPAVLSNVGLFIGLAGGTGSGKTVSAMRLAQGIVGRSNKFAVIDTENGRARHQAPRPGEQPDFVTTFRFDVADLDAPYSSARYEEAVKNAIAGGYRAVVLDSGTHEHDGVGGYLDAQAVDLEQRVERQMKKYPNSNEYDVVDRMTPSSWILPKRARKRMMQTLLACSTSIPVIFCFRAEEKIFKSEKDEKTGKSKLVAMNPPQWKPICGSGMPFEMTVFLMLHRENPGVPTPIKLIRQHTALFPLDRPLDEDSGRRIAEWASGGTKAPSADSFSLSGEPPAYINDDQIAYIETMCQDNGIKLERLKAAAKVDQISMILAGDYARAKTWIDTAIQGRQAA